MKRIRRIIISVIIITALFIIGSIKASACISGVSLVGSTRRVNGHQSQTFPAGSFSGTPPRSGCFHFSGQNGIVELHLTSSGFTFTPKKIGTTTAKVTVDADCSCSGSVLTSTAYYCFSEWGLKSLSVTGYSISPTFYNGTFNYTLSVPYETNKITVNASPNQSNSTMSGTGEHTLNLGDNKITINVKTPQGDSRNYYITVTRGQAITPTGVKINGGNLNLRVNDERQLTYTVTPTNATISNVTWTSTNPSVVSVTNGKIKTLKAGEATIKLQVNHFSSEIKVNVTKSVNSIKATDAMILNPDNSYQLEYTVLPEDATNKKVKFSVNNNLISVDSDGIIKVGSKTGTSILTITSEDSGVKKEITVYISPELEAIDFNQRVLTIKKGDTMVLKPVFKPSDVILEADELTWTSDNTKVLTVSNDGTITAKDIGEAHIKAEFKGVSNDIRIIVIEGNEIRVSEIDAPEEVTIMINDKLELNYSIFPEEATIKEISFFVNNDLIKVNEKGYITAGDKVGTSVITIASYDGEVTKEVTVHIIDEIKVSEIDVQKELTLYKGEKAQLDYTIYPEDATYKDVKFSVNNDLVTVGQTGLITAGDKVGTSVITLTSHDGNIKKNITVNVIEKLEKIAFEKSSYEMKVDDRLQLKLLITPENYDLDYTKVTWSSSDDSIVEISQKGIAVAKKSGYVTIKASIDDLSLTTSSSITVKGEETSVGIIILIIMVCISIPVLLIIGDNYRRNKLRKN